MFHPLRTFLFAALIGFALLAAACGDDDDSEDPTAEATSEATQAEPTETATASPSATAAPTRVEIDPPADPPEDEGPYRVGVTVTQYLKTSVTTGVERTLEVVVWYPTDIVSAADDFLVGIRDAPGSVDAPFPLVIFSHGSGGNTLQSTFLTTHVASHGFVVASVSHPGNTTADCFPCGDQAALQDSYRNRPDDVAFARDQLINDSETKEGSVLLGLIDPEQVGIMGHSFGGYTTMAALVAGGFDAGASLAGAAEFGGTVLPLPGGSDSEIDVPVLLMGGTLDTTTPFTTAANLYERLTAAPAKVLVELPRAGHLAFSNYCLQIVPGCGPNDVDPGVAHNLINLYVTAFFRYYLKGDDGYAQYLLPGSEQDAEAVIVEEDGVQ
ncbi:MAG: dienelactone hydrolase family protein [Dehalococcoidia bacterium]